MSEATSEKAAEVTAETAASAATETEADGFKSEHSKQAVLADLAKEREQRKALQEKLDAFESANLTEIEKAQKQAAAVAERAEQLERDNWRLNALAEHPVPAEYRDLVTGSDADSFMASAEKVSKLATANTATPTTPKPDLTQGATSALPLNGDALENALRAKLGI
jgi:hypothetical protein